MIAEILLGIGGFVFIILGFLIWKKEKMELLHSYHYDKVSEDDRKAFCTVSGIGVIVIGAGILISAFLIGLTDSQISFVAVGIGFVIGLGMLIFGGIRYNR